MILNSKTAYREFDLTPAYKKLLQGLEIPFDAISEINVWNKPGYNEVLLICNYEGSIHFLNNDFISLKRFADNGMENKNSILDFIHPEDVLLTIENLVYLLQEKTESVVFGARFLCRPDEYHYTKWHVGYLRGMFYFYPLDVPVTEMPSLNEFSQKTTQSNKANVTNEKGVFWKKELAETLNAWDKTILYQIKSCTRI
ncbi:MAG: hypothetical protein WD554_05565 [Flavobacteriaceae bacterium]